MFADRIRKAREELQISQREIANAIGVDIPMYSRIERGQRPAKREVIKILSRCLKIDEEELLKLWLAEKIYNYIADEEDAENILDLVTKNIVKHKSKSP